MSGLAPEMPTPDGRWAILNPNPYLSPYPNNVPLFPQTGEDGFAVYYCAPAVHLTALDLFLAFQKPSGIVMTVVPFLAAVPSFLYIPGQPVWCYVFAGSQLDEAGTYYVYLLRNGGRITNNALLFVAGISLPGAPLPGTFELDVSPLDGGRPLG